MWKQLLYIALKSLYFGDYFHQRFSLTVASNLRGKTSIQLFISCAGNSSKTPGMPIIIISNSHVVEEKLNLEKSCNLNGQ